MSLANVLKSGKYLHVYTLGNALNIFILSLKYSPSTVLFMRSYFHHLVLLGLCPVIVVVQFVLLIQKENIILKMFTGWTIDWEFDNYNSRIVDLDRIKIFAAIWEYLCLSNSPQVWLPLACVPRPHSELLSAGTEDWPNFWQSEEKGRKGEICWEYKEPLKPSSEPQK